MLREFIKLITMSFKLTFNSIYYYVIIFQFSGFVIWILTCVLHHLQNMNKIEAYKQTKRDPQELVAVLKKRFSVTLPPC